MSAPNPNNNISSSSNSRPIFSLQRMVDNSSEPGSSDHDRLLPIANVGRIMKQILPQNAKISKEAKETMQECVSEFIGFVTGEASDKCKKERRKTVNGDDICWAMGSLGFDDYAGPLKRYLSRYREIEGERVLNSQMNKDEHVAAGPGQDHMLDQVNHKLFYDASSASSSRYPRDQSG